MNKSKSKNLLVENYIIKDVFSREADIDINGILKNVFLVELEKIESNKQKKSSKIL